MIITEARPSVSLSPLEKAKLANVRNRLTPTVTGSHDALLRRDHVLQISIDRHENDVKDEGRKPFAFDLEREYQLIQEHGEKYRPYFVAQAEYYAKESYGRVPVVEYTHDITKNEKGDIDLQFGPQKESALESYRKPLTDKTLPTWYRKRAMGDVAWVINIQQQLKNAEVGDTFVDMSPTEFNVSVKERKKWGFGWHSFVRIHTVIEENGEKKLVSRALRNYLDLPEQEELYEKLTGKDVPGEFLLGDVGKLRDGLDIGHIEKLSKDLYENTPPERKITPPPADQLFVSEQEMDKKAADIRPWMNRIFTMMKDQASKAHIQKEFQGWEMAMKDMVQGKEIKLDEAHTTSALTQTDASSEDQAIMDHYKSKEYKPGANGCGLGSGFKDENGNVKRTSGNMDYVSFSKKIREYSFDKDGQCNTCHEVTKVGPCGMCEACNDQADVAEMLGQPA